ncbi:hypothetical protein Tco_1300307 [Tanacetum coccineum]
MQKKPHDDGVENKSVSIPDKTTQPLVKPQQSSIPFPNRSLLTNKSRLKEACTETMNERCSAVLLNDLPLKEKDPRSFTIPCQVLEKHKEAEDLATDHLSRFENSHMEVLTEREIVDKLSDEHLMVLKSMFNNDEPWYADFVNYIVGKVVPLNWTFKKRKMVFLQVKTYFWREPYAFKLCADNIMRRCVAGSEPLKILAHCHLGPTGGHHSASGTAMKVYESGFYCPSIFKDANEFGVPKALISDKGQFLLIPSLKKLYKDMGCLLNYHGISINLMDNTEVLIGLKSASRRDSGVNPNSESHLCKLNELAELRDGAYENTRIYKEQTKKWHDSRLRGDKYFKVGTGLASKSMATTFERNISGGDIRRRMMRLSIRLFHLNDTSIYRDISIGVSWGMDTAY